MKVVVLTGAGISAESGIQTFRTSDGLWENHRIDDVATPEGFLRDPKLVQQFYNQRREKLFDPQIQPNAAHFALAKLEQKLGKDFLLVTQNVDNLHERAGSKNLIHMHGELLKVRCVKSGKVYHWEKAITSDDKCSCCNTPQVLRPHIVWFGEMPLEMERIYKRLQECDCFIAIGTSGNVYPAAGFVQEANYARANTVELNLEPSKTHSVFKQGYYGLASQIVPEFVDKLLGKVI
ncbi:MULTISPECIES: Sir2 family NAD+-dependent deacetylase [Pasteurellaceae]|uniref:NAD-dependent protein deacylase n=1 Tax=Pasteurella atlantica TaxID=2827233 RepID=A0AAW8CIV4_9PAST|nr:Sir2 family NAD+-dependent deacetylase [Pasteurella atlantica]MBR0572727.1 NAD-dependent protein deacylase [Pasteurella atlantica]MDP8038672.1 NAD-dependent protein deacylase [Pasteurella atlantica]MDP8040764.1 NAD-dependent protein deacylase [Pasteurella atlantica]MDP8042899.1 NAD-dependent protein deacylase [Pasteurella atlantica]MDP8044986.1 NAD-dependent protein deacylase [Pasteurella atlantica]